jgi:hypothetical protein
MAEVERQEAAPATQALVATTAEASAPLIARPRSCGPDGLIAFRAAADVERRAEVTLSLQRTSGNRAVARMILEGAPAVLEIARVPTRTPPRKPAHMQPEGDPTLAIDPALLDRARDERSQVGVADEDFKRNIAVILYERDGKRGVVSAANDPESSMHSEEVCIGELWSHDKGGRGPRSSPSSPSASRAPRSAGRSSTATAGRAASTSRFTSGSRTSGRLGSARRF